MPFIANGAPVDRVQVDALDALDDFSLLDVFDWLHFGDLATLAAISARYNALISAHLLRQYRLDEGRVKVMLTCDDRVAVTHEHPKFDGGREKIACGPSQTHATLATFGYLFTDMEIVVDNAECAPFAELVDFDAYAFSAAAHVVADLNIAADAPLVRLGEMFPTATNLTVRSNNRVSFDGHFEHVKSFVLRLIDDTDEFAILPDFPAAIAFDCLESFELAADVEHANAELIGLIVRNRDLRRVTVARFELSAGDFAHLIEPLDQLEEIVFSYPTRGEIWELFRFLDTATTAARILAVTGANDIGVFEHVNGLAERSGAYRMAHEEDDRGTVRVTFLRN